MNYYYLILSLALFQFTAIHAIQDPDRVEKELDNYMESRTSMLIMKRSGSEAVGRCYSNYIPQITRISGRSQVETASCMTISETRRSDEMAKVKDHHMSLMRDIEIIENSLEMCRNKSENVRAYLKCLKNNAEANTRAMEEISRLSVGISMKIEESMTDIENYENDCVQGVIRKSKSDTDILFASLQRCLMNPDSIRVQSKPPQYPQRSQILFEPSPIPQKIYESEPTFTGEPHQVKFIQKPEPKPETVESPTAAHPVQELAANESERLEESKPKPSAVESPSSAHLVQEPAAKVESPASNEAQLVQEAKSKPTETDPAPSNQASHIEEPLTKAESPESNLTSENSEEEALPKSTESTEENEDEKTEEDAE